RILPGHEYAAQVEPIGLVGNDQKRPAGLHDEVLRTCERKGVRKGRAMSAADDDIGRARLFEDEASRKIQRAAPFNKARAIPRRLAELRFQFLEPVPDARLALVDQGLRLFAVGEIERWRKLRGGNPDQPRADLLGELACNLEARLIGLVKRQANHDGCDSHSGSPRQNSIFSLGPNLTAKLR